MQYNIKKFTETTEGYWDSCVEKISATSVGHSWSFLNYLSCFQNVVKNESFICFDQDDEPVAICPYIISKIDNTAFELSSNGAPVTVPALNYANPSKRRRLFNWIINRYYTLSQENNIRSGKLIFNSLTIAAANKEEPLDKYYFELLGYNMVPLLLNTIVIDLGDEEENLVSNLSKYHRKNIRRAEKQNIEFKTIDSRVSKGDEIEETMKIVQELHLKAAGKSTRPQSTWDSMLNTVEKGKASIFLGLIGGKVVSYLYCGVYNRIAFGWSQANDEEYVEDYYVRHLLEWKAILYFKSLGFKYYELGERHFFPQLFYNPTNKEATISQFKQNYGGHLMSKIIWTMYFDIEYMKENFSKEMEIYRDTYIKNQSELLLQLSEK